jgi:hypothetical protein
MLADCPWLRVRVDGDAETGMPAGLLVALTITVHVPGVGDEGEDDGGE